MSRAAPQRSSPALDRLHGLSGTSGRRWAGAIAPDTRLADGDQAAAHGHQGRQSGLHVTVVGADHDDVVGVVGHAGGQGPALRPKPRTKPMPVRPLPV